VDMGSRSIRVVARAEDMFGLDWLEQSKLSSGKVVSMELRQLSTSWRRHNSSRLSTRS
jgi:hypothetical protein